MLCAAIEILVKQTNTVMKSTFLLLERYGRDQNGMKLGSTAQSKTLDIKQRPRKPEQ